MDRIALGLFIFQVIFTLGDFPPYRDRSHRFGKFDTRVKGKYVFFFLLVIGHIPYSTNLRIFTAPPDL